MLGGLNGYKKSHPVPVKGTEQLGGATQFSRYIYAAHFKSDNAGYAPQFSAGLRGRLGDEWYKGFSAKGLLSVIHHYLLILFNVIFPIIL